MRIIFWILSLIILISCSHNQDDRTVPPCDKNCTTVQGKFLTENWKVPVAGMNVSLEWALVGELGGSVRQIATTKTDNEGFYSFSFYIEDHELTEGLFIINFKTPNNSFLKPIYPYFKFGINKRDTVINYDYLLPKQSYIKIIVDRQTSNYDYLLCNVMYCAGDGMVVCDELDSRKENQKIVETAGNQYTYLQIIKNKGEQRSFIKDSIMVYLNDTAAYYIK